MKKVLFIDRDGTIIREPKDFQIDSFDKLDFVEGVIPALLQLKSMGFKFVMISNQDGLGTDSFPSENFYSVHNKLISILSSQGITFEDTLICPHFSDDNCDCRKPKLGMVVNHLRDSSIDFDNSYVLGDRDSDQKLAENMKIRFIRIFEENTAASGHSWQEAVAIIKNSDRKAEVRRKTKETDIKVEINLDRNESIDISTGIGFFDHMLEQIAKHASVGLIIKVKGDLEIDDHHTVEDTGIALGEAISKALSDRFGLERYGFSLPMDEASCSVLLDLGGRPFFKFDGLFQREKLGELSTEMIKHFFRSVSESLKANLHVKIEGENDHHKAEGAFKAFAKALRQAIIVDYTKGLPSTKGVM